MEMCSDAIDANLFRASDVNGTRLHALAIHHAMPSISCIPIWSNETAFIITRAVLKQKGKMTRAMLTAHQEGTLELPWSNLNTKGVPSYRAITSLGPTFTLRTFIPNQAELIRDAIDPANVLEYSDHFACPKCLAYRNIARCSLLVSSGWGHILCFSCRATSRSMNWRCICNIAWHTCTVHSARIRAIESEPDQMSRQIVLH